LIKKPAVSDLFGLAGREWLREVELPAWERETVDGCLRARSSSSTGDRRGREAGRPRRVDLIADQAADDGPRRQRGRRRGRRHRLLPVAAAARRLSRARPTRSQSGSAPATHGRISKQGSASARLVEASWSVVRQPGPLHAFYQRIRARRGYQVAVAAAARKLACLFWCMLTRAEDYHLRSSNRR